MGTYLFEAWHLYATWKTRLSLLSLTCVKPCYNRHLYQTYSDWWTKKLVPKVIALLGKTPNTNYDPQRSTNRAIVNTITWYKYSVAALSAMAGLPTREHLLLQDCTSVSDASILTLLKIFLLICKFLVVFEGRGKGLFNIIIITAVTTLHTPLFTKLQCFAPGDPRILCV